MAEVSDIGGVSAWDSALLGWLEGCTAKVEMVYVKASDIIAITYSCFIFCAPTGDLRGLCCVRINCPSGSGTLAGKKYSQGAQQRESDRDKYGAIPPG